MRGNDEIRKVLPSLIRYISAFLAGCLFGVLIVQFFFKVSPEIKEVREGQFQFVNPLLECSKSDQLISRELRQFRAMMENKIEEEVGAGNASLISVYFRDLNNGPAFGINDSSAFLPGSLLKIPILMGFLKRGEEEPSIMKTVLPFDQPPPMDYSVYVKPTSEIKFGQKYEASELIFRMIVHSDNMAAHLLSRVDDGKLIERVFNDLSIPVPFGDHEYEINVRTYASFFRYLFNASYLSRENSNEALRLLAASEFRRGLAAGVPSGITVAHKFGERTGEDGERQFHDCGIIYYPGYPFLLCVMARGNDYEKMITAIREISYMTYGEVERQLGERDQERDILY